ncbi:MAG: YkgJ family cysteine cluster protein [Candidatus Hodarchaeota archaeon]
MSVDCERFCPDVRECCQETEMTLTRRDVERINALGYSTDDYVHRVMGGFCELKNIDGHCYFYDTASKICRIYDARPEGCRWYPVVYHFVKRKCLADGDCPASPTFTRDRIRKVCHKVKSLVELLRKEAAHGESPC